MRKKRTERYYLFTDEKTKKMFFHNAVTNVVTWFPPVDSVIIDPQTLKTVTIDLNALQEAYNACKQPTHHDVGKKRERYLARKASLPIYNNPVPPKNFHNRKLTLVKLSTSSLDKNQLILQEIPIYLPTSIFQDSTPIDIRSFAAEKFNTRYRGSFFNKKEIPPDELLLFDTDSSVLPILKSTPSSLQKQCVEVFNFIINYCKQSAKAQPNVLVELLFKERSIINEAYILLFKFIRNNPVNENITKVWDLILVVCTFFPASPEIQPLVKYYLSTEALGTKANINTTAKIAYFRFCARCASREAFHVQSAQWINFIPMHVYQDTFICGAPLLELIFSQRRSAPKCTIPLFLHRFVNILLSKGIESTEGNFRATGDKAQVDALVEDINNGKETYKNAKIDDMAGLFKRWFADLPEPFIPMSMFEKLVKAQKENKIIEFINKLPRVNHDTLGYLVGFLQQIVKSADVTKMGVVQCSMLFGPNVARIITDDQTIAKDSANVGKDVLTYLIKNWDTKFIYPLPVEYIT